MMFAASVASLIISSYSLLILLSHSLAGTIALLKLQQTRVAQQVSDQTVQILGGRGITKHGLGGNVERFLRSFKYGAVTGGSEEIMATLGMRQALRSLPKDDPLARL